MPFCRRGSQIYLIFFFFKFIYLQSFSCLHKCPFHIFPIIKYVFFKKEEKKNSFIINEKSHYFQMCLIYIRHQELQYWIRPQIHLAQGGVESAVPRSPRNVPLMKCSFSDLLTIRNPVTWRLFKLSINSRDLDLIPIKRPITMCLPSLISKVFITILQNKLGQWDYHIFLVREPFLFCTGNRTT